MKLIVINTKSPKQLLNPHEIFQTSHKHHNTLYALQLETDIKYDMKTSSVTSFDVPTKSWNDINYGSIWVTSNKWNGK
jgi:hypothetical protein